MKTVGLQIGVGRTSRLLAYGTDSVLKVLRFGLPPHWMRTEFEITRIVFDAGLPVPEPRALTHVDGQPAIEFEYIPAPSLWDLVVSGRCPVDRAAEILAELHRRITTPAAPPGIHPLIQRLRAKIHGLPQLPPADRDLAETLLRRLACGNRLLHGDLHPGNVLMADHHPLVIDWLDAAAGPPTADTVRTSILIRPRRPAAGIGRRDNRTAAPPHLPGATDEILQPLHDGYMRRARAIDSSDPLAVELLEGVSALGRLAEKSEFDDGMLRRLWSTTRQLAASPPLGDGAG